MTWLRPRWHWVAFNLVALAVLVYVLTQGSTEWRRSDTFDPMLESGKWGIRFLLLSLTMTPLHTYLRWSLGLKLRKSLGLWAFAFAGLHLTYSAIERWEAIRSVTKIPWPWALWSMDHFIVLGLSGLTLLTALAVTSNKWSMRRLGKNWKRLHRSVYAAGIAAVAHGLLAPTMSKKVFVRDPEAASELRVYLVILAILLLVRIPPVRAILLKIVAVARPQVCPIEQPIPQTLPRRTPPQWPALSTQKELLLFDGTFDSTFDSTNLSVETQPHEAAPANASQCEKSY